MMKYRTKLIIIGLVIFILITNISLTFASENISNQSTTWIVDDEGDGDFKSIQTAVKNANSGDTIEVYSGTYKENIEINKQLILIGIASELGAGDDTGRPLIQGIGIGNVVELLTDGCKISGFEVANSGINYKSGILAKNTKNHVITENYVRNNYLGIYLSKSTDSIITKNIVKSCVFGIQMQEPENNIIVNNTLISTGLAFFGGTYEQVFSNIIENNTVNGRPIYYYKNQNNFIIPEDAGQVILINCHDVEIKNLDLHDTSIGLIIENSTNLTITNNYFKNIHRGAISHENSNNNKIIENIFENTSWAIYMRNAHNNIIHRNNFIKIGRHDMPVFGYYKKYETFIYCFNNSWDNNYWDNWIGLKIKALQSFPKIIIGYLIEPRKFIKIPSFNFDKNPALEPYDFS